MRKKLTSIFSHSLMISLVLMLNSVDMAGQVSGTVFRDFNANGQKDNSSTFNEPFVANVMVTAYPVSGSAQTTTTNSTGAYSFTGLTLPARIEFSLPNAAVYTAQFGATSTTSVQFYSAPTTAANFGIQNPSHFSQPNPDLVIPKYLNGDPLASGNDLANDPAFYRFPNTAMGNAQAGGTPVTPIATQAQIGSTWGVAYDRKRKKVFLSAHYKRHAPLGPGETGGQIFYIDDPVGSPGTPTLLLDLVADLGISVGTIETNATRQLSPTKGNASPDNNAFAAVGKVSLGDLDISDDGEFLYVVNLHDRKVYQINIAQAVGGTPNALALPDFADPNCTNGIARPWGLGFWDGELYLGIVCTGEAGGTTTDLNLIIQKYNFTSGIWTTVLDVTPDWEKGDIAFGGAKKKWQPWTDDYTDYVFPGGCNNPQPFIADIEFDGEGSIHLAVLDRVGIQTGHRNYVPFNTSLTTGITGGELLRTYRDPVSGLISLEENAVAGPYISGGTGDNSQTGQGGPNTLQGPGGGEFYADDHTATAHSETTNGGLTLIKGSQRLASVQMDPIDGQVDASGVVWFDITNGLETQEYQIFFNAATPSPDFSKQNGLGDLEYLSDPAPLEIGNRIWTDTDSDGIQDPDEAGIDGIVVKLFKNGTQVGQTTTANGGQWYFNNANVTMNGATGLEYDMDYIIRVEGSEFPSGLGLTTANVGGAGQPDVRDSDATLVGGNAEIAYTTGGPGENDHTLDMGFAAAAMGCPSAFTPTDYEALGWQSSPLACGANPGNNSQSFPNWEGTGVTATFTYSTNMWDGDAPNIYKSADDPPSGCDPQSSMGINDVHCASNYWGALRWTSNEMNTGETTMEVSFDQPVFLDLARIGSISVLTNNMGVDAWEWVHFSAYDAANNIVPITPANGTGAYMDCSNNITPGEVIFVSDGNGGLYINTTNIVKQNLGLYAHADIEIPGTPITRIAVEHWASISDTDESVRTARKASIILNVLCISPAPVSGCDLQVQATPTCQMPLNGKYDLDVTLDYTNGPGGNITVTLGTGESTSVATTAGDGSVTASFTGLSNSGQSGISVDAAFDADPTCAAAITYDAPADCCPATNYEICPGESFTLTVEAGLGLTNIQWYKDGVAIPAPEGTQESYIATMIGTYTYTADGMDGCPFGLCCPVEIVESMNCCEIDIVDITVSDCFEGTYSIEVDVAYNLAQAGNIVLTINGQNHILNAAAGMGTMTFNISGLTCANGSGETTTVEVYSEDDPTCRDEAPINVPELILDMGDLPAPYATRLVDDGPRHTLTPLLYLGNCVDNELDGQPAPLAGRTIGGDDAGAQQMFTYGTCAVANDDENGLLTVTEISPGAPLKLCINASNTYGQDAYLTAWIDWNGNGILEAGEQVVNAIVSSGPLYTNCFTVIVPNTSVRDQDLGVRIRLNLNAPAGPTGLAIGGEVEDYMIRITCPDEPCLPAQISR